jgi:beta-N-acetylhexosaminidase
MKRNYTPADAAIRAFNAGVDMLMLAEEHYEHDSVNYLRQQTELIQAVVMAVRNDVLLHARLTLLSVASCASSAHWSARSRYCTLL